MWNYKELCQFIQNITQLFQTLPNYSELYEIPYKSDPRSLKLNLPMFGWWLPQSYYIIIEVAFNLDIFLFIEPIQATWKATWWLQQKLNMLLLCYYNSSVVDYPIEQLQFELSKLKVFPGF